MQKICDICGTSPATREDRVVQNGSAVQYAYCEACYNRALKSGVLPQTEAQTAISRRGKVCRSCGCTAEEFATSLRFGCPECYSQMREVAMRATVELQGAPCAKTVPEFAKAKTEVKGEGFKSADECSAEELTRDNVVSSRVRLARNVRGLTFSLAGESDRVRFAEVVKRAKAVADGIFDNRLALMSNLTDAQKKVLLERHFISLPLANNESCGAVIIERGEEPQMSIMLGEEDHIREQCVTKGHSLLNAYERIKRYDIALKSAVDIAYDREIGYLTACPTNVGTGMRASEMLFLPALQRAGAIEDALKTFKEAYGLTVRGYFGEGSDSAYGMYQISNSRTFGVNGDETLRQVEQAVVRMCYCERVALEKLVREHRTQLIDGIFRSYSVLSGAYSLTLQELMKLLVDVRIGVILGILPVKSTKVLNAIAEQCSSSLEITTEGVSAQDLNRERAKKVRDILAEAK